MMLELSLFEG